MIQKFLWPTKPLSRCKLSLESNLASDFCNEYVTTHQKALGCDSSFWPADLVFCRRFKYHPAKWGTPMAAILSA